MVIESSIFLKVFIINLPKELNIISFNGLSSGNK